MATDKTGQGIWPQRPSGKAVVESNDGIGRVEGNRVTLSSYDKTSVEELPYRDTVTGRYRKRQ